MNKCILVIGNLSDGFRFVGPFDEFDEAVQFSEGVDTDNWVATLEPAGKSDLMLAAEAVAAIEFFVDETYCLTSEAAKAVQDLKAAVKKARGE